MTRHDPIPPLFAPHNGTRTSKAAAKAVAPAFGERTARILNLIRAHPGTTRDGIALLGVPIQSVCSCVRALVKAGAVYERGQAATSSGKSGMRLWAREAA